MSTNYNAKTPLKVYNPSDETVYKVYLGSSPRRLCADGRTDDLTAIISLIDSAEKFIYIAVGEYIPMDLFKDNEMWTAIDDRLRAGIDYSFECAEKSLETLGREIFIRREGALLLVELSINFKLICWKRRK